MSDHAGTVIVLAKEPVPGRVKTRLQPVFTPGEAARLAAASLEDTLATVRSCRRAAGYSRGKAIRRLGGILSR